MKTTTRKRPPRHAAFLALGVVFLILGIGNNRAFLGMGAAYFVIGVAGLMKERKARRNEGKESSPF